jgi:CHAT domain-containing protein/tetratricopeptide (TPR) repeat protein
MKTIKTLAIFLTVFMCLNATQAQINIVFRDKINHIDTLLKHKKFKEAKDSLNQITLDFPEIKLEKIDQLKLNTVVANFHAHVIHNKAISYTASKKTLLLAKELYPNDIEMQFKSIITHLIVLKSFADNALIINHIESNLKEWEGLLSKKSPTLSTIYRRFGLSYNALGNFEKGEFYLNQSLNILAGIEGEHSSKLADLYKTIGFSYKNMDLEEKAIQYFKKAVEIFEFDKKEPSVNLAEVYTFMGESYAALNMADFSITYNLKALDEYLKIYDPENERLIWLWNSLGLSYSIKKDYEQSIFYYEKALKIDPEFPYALHTLARIYTIKKDYEKANFYFDKVLKIKQYTEGVNYAKMNDLQDFDKFLLGKVKLFQLQYEETNNIEFLEKALKVLAEMKRFNIFNIERFDESNNKEAYYGNALYNQNMTIDLDYKCFEITKNQRFLQHAFDQSEFAKSLLTFQLFQNNRKENIENIPPELLEKEKIQLEKIANIEKLLNENDNVSINKQLLFELKKEHEPIKINILKYCKNYYNSTITIPENICPIIQSKLDNDQTLLEYQLSDTSIYFSIINKDSLVIKYTKIDSNFWLNIKQFQNSISTNIVGNNYLINSTNYCASAYYLYQKLIFPIEKLIKKRLIIVSDGILNALPFEALLATACTRSDRYQQHDYVLLHQTISYAPSAIIWAEMLKKTDNTPQKEPFLGIAPFYDQSTVYMDSLKLLASINRNGLNTLPFSGEEIYKAAKIFNGKTMVGKEASLIDISKILAHYKILHFATHGKANKEKGTFSYLALSPLYTPYRLYAKDITNLNLDNPELVVLSACESGVGELQAGEGMISIAKSFIQSGAQSIVTTLWNVNDEKTKELMTYFYQNLKKGMPKDVALQAAKRLYIEHNKGEFANPLYWSAFIGIGNMNPLKR